MQDKIKDSEILTTGLRLRLTATDMTKLTKRCQELNTTRSELIRAYVRYINNSGVPVCLQKE